MSRENLRILYVALVDVTLPNGSGVNEREFIISLAEKLNNRATFIIPHSARELSDFKDINMKIHAPYSLLNPIKVAYFQLSLFITLWKTFRHEEKIDLIVVRLEPFPIAFWVFIKTVKIPFAIKTFSTGFNAIGSDGRGTFGNFYTQVKNILFYIAQNTVTKSLARSAICIDSCTLEIINHSSSRLKLKPEKFCLIENATNVDRFSPANRIECVQKIQLPEALKEFIVCAERPIILGYIGGRPWERGGIEIIKVLSSLRHQGFKNVKGLIIGGEEQSTGLDYMVATARELGIANSCFCIGTIDYALAAHYINIFDIGFAIENDMLVKLKGNSNQKIRQYVACGKPVIASAGGSEFLKTEKLGSIIESDNIDKICEETIRWIHIISDEVLQTQHVVKARSYARKHLSNSKTTEERISQWMSCLRQ